MKERGKGIQTVVGCYIYSLIYRANLAQMGMCQCRDCRFVANQLLIINFHCLVPLTWWAVRDLVVVYNSFME